jgi:hypothetical protein
MFRRLALVCVLAVAVAAQTPQPGAKASATFRISGTVVDAAGGQPLAGAIVMTGPAEGNDPALRVTAGDDGRFEFRGLAPRKYWLTAEARGYMRQNFDQHEEYSTAIAVGPNLQSEGLVFRMRPDASVAGTVTDEAGDPIRGAQVMLFHNAIEGGRRTTHLRTQAATDDQGHYHLGHVIPGTYFVAVSAQPWYAQRPQHQQVGGGFGGSRVVESQNAASPPGAPPPASVEEVRSPLDVAYPVTFYAGVTDAAAATPLVVKSGDRAAADVTLAAVPAVHLVIKGVSSNPETGYSANLQQHLFGGTAIVVAGQSSRVGNDIVIDGAPPGQAEISLQTFGQSPSSWSGKVGLSADTEINAAEVSTSPAISGVAEMDGRTVPRQAFIQLWNPASGASIGGQVADKGEFHLDPQEVQPGSYEVRVFNVPGAEVSAVSAEGAKAIGQTVQINGGGPVRLKVTLSRSLARLDGRALRNGKPAAGAMVMLVPRNAKNNATLFRRDQSDSDGTFTLRSVLPGTYTVVALAEGWDLEWQDPAVLKPYLKQGEVVEVSPGRKYQLEIKVQ